MGHRKYFGAFFGCWLQKAIHTYAFGICNTLIAILLQQQFHKCTSVLHLTFIARVFVKISKQKRKCV